MGRDNQPKHRQRKQLERKRNQRASYDRILIVSEGSKTEPQYFDEIRREYRLHTANVQIHPSALGTEPRQVVQYAHDLFVNGDIHRKIAPRSFEKVYAVFDRDDHRTYHEALDYAERLDGRLANDNKQKVKFVAIASVPSFELWLLLHYESILAPMHRDEVLRRVTQHIDGYEKGRKGVFGETRSLLDEAMTRAGELAEQNTPYDGYEPYTCIACLVNLLINLPVR